MCAFRYPAARCALAVAVRIDPMTAPTAAAGMGMPPRVSFQARGRGRCLAWLELPGGFRVHHVSLDNQFRCGGSRKHEKWVLRLLGLETGGRERHIRNIYKVLLTGGMVGTVIYAVDPWPRVANIGSSG